MREHLLNHYLTQLSIIAYFRQHHRSFVREMPRVGFAYGFEEMGPNQTARDLFGHLQAGEKLAIISRFDRSAFEDQLMESLEHRGVQVRFITGQSGVQDFCFLMNVKKEMVGSGISTYFLWAGILGNASKVRSYFLNTPEQQRLLGGDFLRLAYVFKTHDWRARYSPELYNVSREIGRRRWFR
jgi:hypothetical protein